MALTLAQRDALTTNATFLSRVRAAVGRQAQYYIDLGNGATTAQQDWAANVFWAGRRLNQIAVDLAPQLVNTVAIINAGTADASDVIDDDLQAAVGSICGNYQ